MYGESSPVRAGERFAAEVLRLTKAKGKWWRYRGYIDVVQANRALDPISGVGGCEVLYRGDGRQPCGVETRMKDVWV